LVTPSESYETSLATRIYDPAEKQRRVLERERCARSRIAAADVTAADAADVAAADVTAADVAAADAADVDAADVAAADAADVDAADAAARSVLDESPKMMYRGRGRPTMMLHWVQMCQGQGVARVLVSPAADVDAAEAAARSSA